MSKIVGDEPCPSCRAKGGDATGNHLMRFEDGGGYCNRCGYTEKSGEPTFTEKATDTMAEFNEVKALPIMALKDRGIDKDVCEHYGIHTEFNTETGKPSAYYYPFTVGGTVKAYKKRTLPKTFTSVGESLKGQTLQFIGQAYCGTNKKLLITEGQDDMLAAFQMLWRSYPKLKPSVVSLPNGANVKAFTDNKQFLEQFSEIIFCGDDDEAGKKVAKDIANLYPDIKFMALSEKDANEMLLKGKAKEFINAFFKAETHIPDSLITVDDVYDEAIEMPTWGRLWPWPKLNEYTYGRHNGQGIYVGAAVKAGKTAWKDQMAEHIIVAEGSKVFTCSFEQSGANLVKAVAGKLAHKQFHKPDGDFTQEELTEAVNQVRGKILMFDASYADISAGNMWDRLKPAIRHAVVVEGVKDVMIDPITQLTDGMTPSETETELRRFSNELAGMAKELDFFYYCFCHLKAPLQGKTHEEGGKVKVAQFRGSRAMAEKTKLMLGIGRDQYAEDEIERNTSHHHLLLNSGFGKTGTFDVFYDDNTGTYLEPPKEFE